VQTLDTDLDALRPICQTRKITFIGGVRRNSDRDNGVYLCDNQELIDGESSTLVIAITWATHHPLLRSQVAKVSR
jgi:hypothetical protein